MSGRGIVTHYRSASWRVLLGAALGLALGAAQAQEVNTGKINAASYMPIPPGASVEVVLLDDSPENVELKESFEQALTARGVSVDPGAPYQLSFNTSGTFRSGENPRISDFVNIDGEGGNSESSDVRGRVNVFSSRGPSLIQRGRPTREISSSRLSLEAQVRETATGRHAWRAQAYAVTQGEDPQQVTMALIPFVVDSLGKTVRQRTISLP
jgi:hypothetical protein